MLSAAMARLASAHAALASGAAVADADPEVDQVIICTPDKDLGQCVRGTRIVQLDRRKDMLIDEGGVTAKFGVGPASIPDYLALVGDSADGFPGLAGWGAKSAATVLARWNHVEDIPADPRDWEVTVRGAAKLGTTLRECRDDALLFKELATLRIDRSLLGRVDDLRWRGPTDEFADVCAVLDAPGIARRADALAADTRAGDDGRTDARFRCDQIPRYQPGTAQVHQGSYRAVGWITDVALSG